MSSQTFSTFSEVGMIDARSQNGIITLPLTTDIPYRILTLKDIYGASVASSITLTTQGADVFEDGTTSRILNGAFETTTLYAGQAGFWYTTGGSRLASAAIGSLSTGLITNPLRLGTLSTQTAIQFPGLRTNYTGTVIAGQTTGAGTQELLLYQASSISDQIRLQTTGNIVFEAGAAARSFPSTQALATPTLYIAGTTSNVGVGTATPGSLLDVAGVARAQTISTLTLNTSTINGIIPGAAFNGSTTSLSSATITTSTLATNIFTTSSITSYGNVDIQGSILSNVATEYFVKPVYTSVFTPASIPNLKVWADASKLTSITSNGSGLVLLLSNLTGLGNFASNAGLTPPTTGAFTMNNLNTLSFGGANALVLPSITYTSAYRSLFVVAQTTGNTPFFGVGSPTGSITTANYGSYFYAIGSNANISYYPISGSYLNMPLLVSLYTTSTSNGIFLNGSNIGAISPATFATGSFVDQLGVAGSGGSLQGNYYGASWNFCEVLLYDGVLTPAQRQLVEGYLGWKWGFQTGLIATQPYYSSVPPPFGTAFVAAGSITTDANSNVSFAATNKIRLTAAVEIPTTLIASSMTVSSINGSTVTQLIGAPIQSTVIGLATAGYISSTQLNSTVSGLIITAAAAFTGSTVSLSSGSIYASNITMSGTVNMCNNAISNVSNTVFSYPTSSFIPTSITGCQLWLDAADPTVFTYSSGSNISAWADKSSNANNLTVTNSYGGTVPPTRLVDGSITVVNFPGTSILQGTKQITYTATSAFFIVMRATTTPTGIQNIFSFPSVASACALRINPSGLNGTASQTGDVNDVGNGTYYVNGSFNPSNLTVGTVTTNYVLINTINPTTPGGPTDIIFGGQFASQRYYIGNIAEFLYYPGGVTSNQRLSIEGYLAWKWSINTLLPSSNPYYSSPPAVSWVALGNVTYDTTSNLKITATNAIRLASAVQIPTTLTASSVTVSTININYFSSVQGYVSSLRTDNLTVGPIDGFVTIQDLTTGTVSTGQLVAGAGFISSLQINSLSFGPTGYVIVGNFIASSLSTMKLNTQNLYTNNAYIGNVSSQSAILFPGVDGNFKGTAVAEQRTGPGTEELLLYKVSTTTDQIRLQTTGNIVFEAGASARSWPSTQTLATPTFYIQGTTSNIGVGTATPAATLDVVGTGRFQTISSYALNVSSINGVAAAPLLNGSTLSLSTGSVYASNVVVKKNGNLTSNVYGPGFDALSIQSPNGGLTGGIASLYFGASNANYPLARIGAIDQGSTYANSALVFQTATSNANSGLSGTTVYNYTGADQTYTVPAGVTSISVYLWGAGGGTGNWSSQGTIYFISGGAGAMVQGTLAVTPGQVLTVGVGQGGSSNLSATYGGGGSHIRNDGASGGGRSFIALSGNDLVTAGGGGGAGFNSGSQTGPNGIAAVILGTTNLRPTQPTNCIAGSGTQSEGGQGGTGNYTAGNAGTQYTGGSAPGYGGGGGGGYWGGGGGSADDSVGAGGGGGGSSYIANLASAQTYVSPNQSAIGASASAPNTASPYYTGSVGVGGNLASNNGAGGNGLIVISVSASYNLSETMRISKDAYVGIGTSSPTTLLDVGGTARAQTISTLTLNTSTINGIIPGAAFNGSTMGLSSAYILVSSVNATQLTASNLTVNGTETINFNGGIGPSAYGTGVDTLSLKSPLTAYNGGIASLFFGNGTPAYPLARIAAVDAAASAPGASALLFQTATAAGNAGLSGITTFSYTGADQTYTVPAGATSVTVYMWGAGGGGYQSTGGAGAYIQGTLTVTPGQTLKIMVGQGGVNGSRAVTYGGGGGNRGVLVASAGGRSAIQITSPATITTASGSGSVVTYTTNTAHGLAIGQPIIISGSIIPSGYTGTFVVLNVLSSTQFTVTSATTGTSSGSGTIVAEIVDVGGGGSGGYVNGGAASYSGTASSGTSASTAGGGSGGTQTAGGAAGTGSDVAQFGSPTAGSVFNGGFGADYGGGGGGGYYGGGGGATIPGNVAGGGGGSSYTTNASFAIITGSNSANGYSAPATGVSGYVSGVATGGASTNGGPGLVIISSAPAYVMAEAMRINSNAYVGIGTATPQSLLHVSGMTYSIAVSTQALTISSINGQTFGAPIQSTVIGLGTAGYVSTANLLGHVSTANLIGLISTQNLVGLVSTTYLTTQLQSTVDGLGTVNYISSASLLSTARGLALQFGTSSISSAFITATQGYISSLIVDSLAIGSNSGFINMGDIITTSISSLQINTGLFTASGAVCTPQLLVSSINGQQPLTLQNLTSTVTGTNSNISSMIDPTELTSTITGLGTAGFISTIGLTYVVASTAQGLGTFGYTSTNQLLSTTLGIYGAIGSNIATTVQPQFTSTVQGLGTAGYISSSQLYSTVTGIGSGFTGSTTRLSAAQITVSTISSFLITTGSIYAPAISTSAIVFGTGTGTLLMPDIAPNTLYTSTATASNVQVGWSSNQSPIQFYGFGTYSNSVIVEQSTGSTTQELLVFRGSNIADRIRLQTTGYLSIETGVSSRLYPNTYSNALPTIMIDTRSNVGILLSTPVFSLDVGSTVRAIALSTLLLQTSTIQGATFNRNLYVNYASTFLMDEVSTSFLQGNYNSLLFRTAGTQRAILTQAGYLGVGTSNPQYTVDIAGTTRLSTLYYSTSISYNLISAPLLMASTVNTGNVQVTNVSTAQVNTSTIYGRWDDAQYYVLQTL